MNEDAPTLTRQKPPTGETAMETAHQPITLDEIHALERKWQKAYDIAKARESAQGHDRHRYWLEVHMAWRVQDAIRSRINAMVDRYVEQELDRLVARLMNDDLLRRAHAKRGVDKQFRAFIQRQALLRLRPLLRIR